MIKEEEISDLLKKKFGRSLPGFENINKKATRRRAKKIINYLKERENRMKNDCQNCDQKKAKKNQWMEVFDTPWNDKPEKKHFCSMECGEEYLYGNHDFKYFDCPSCNRTICEQNPLNGYHIQFRFIDDEQICLSCYEKNILENGVSREKFEDKTIAGMFFSYGNTEAIDQGYEEISDFQNILIKSQKTIDEYCKKALELIDQGFNVINAYESLGIGGGEGYVTMLAKKL